MDGVLNNVFNCDELSASDDNNEFDNETPEEANDTDVEIVSSIGSEICSARSRGSSHSSRDDETAGNQETSLGVNDEIQLQTSSLLSVLKAPKASNLSRKQVQAKNPPCGKRRCRGTSTYDPKGIGPAQRVREYPNEPFSVSNKKLFCKACREELSIKKSSVENHIKLSKHVKGKERMSKKET